MTKFLPSPKEQTLKITQQSRRRLGEYEQQIDRMVYGLCSMIEQEIRVVAGETKESVMKPSNEGIDAYLQDYFQSGKECKKKTALFEVE